jgi:aminopeptidase
VKLAVNLPHAETVLFEHADDEQLGYLWESDLWLYQNCDAMFAIWGDVNTRQLTRVDPGRQALAAKGRRPLLDTQMQRTAAGSFRWCATLFPTEANAIDADRSLPEYEDFYFRACLVDRPDPIAAWRGVAEQNQRIAQWLQGRKEVRLEGEGTDLRLDVSGRTWIPCDGNLNFPDGEIFTGPVEDGTRGVVTFSYPASYGGKKVEGIRLEFDEGTVVGASADSGEPFLKEMLNTDDGSRTLGELGIGTNFGIDEFTGHTLLDEKIGGTIHMALGAAYPESGGVNKSAIHWDMVCDLRRGGRITADGEPLMEDGRLLV